MTGASNAITSPFEKYWVVLTQVMLGYSIYDHVMNSLFRDPLFSIQSPLSNRDKKQIPGGFIDLQRKGVGVL